MDAQRRAHWAREKSVKLPVKRDFTWKMEGRNPNANKLEWGDFALLIVIRRLNRKPVHVVRLAIFRSDSLAGEEMQSGMMGGTVRSAAINLCQRLRMNNFLVSSLRRGECPSRLLLVTDAGLIDLSWWTGREPSG